MKILIYSHDFLPVPGGLQSVVLELARGLSAWTVSQAGNEAMEVIVVTQTPELMDQENDEPFGIVRCPGFWKVLQLLREADIVHLAGPALLPLGLALLLGKPVVIEHHGFQAACPNGLLFFEPTQAPCPGHFMAGRYSKCVECNKGRVGLLKSMRSLLGTHLRRWLADRAAFNITPTDWLAIVLGLRRMRTVYHGISPSPAPDAAPPAPTELSPPSDSTFAYLGRLVSTKGVEVLLEAVKQLRKANYKFQLKIIGDGPENRPLKTRAAQLNGQIEFLGHVPEGKIEAALVDVSAVVMPSLGGEVFGLVAAENMFRGKLLIISDIGALQEVVGETGLVFRTGDAGGLAACMREVIEKPSLAGTLGSAARLRAVQVFNRDSMIRGHVALYREALLH
ncbi:MAG: glycosyltransferase family 4 protein [Candidatus Acidiferrales bacterium]